MGAAKNICVIGAGVSGLETARVVKNSYPKANIKVVSKDDPRDTLSCRVPPALVINHPLNVYDEKTDDLLRWQEATRDRMRLLKNDTRTGVSPCTGRIVTDLEPIVKEPVWKDHIESFNILGSAELDSPFSFGWEIGTYLVNMRMYFDYLLAELKQKGVIFERKEIPSLQEFIHKSRDKIDMFLVCAGLGTRDLVPDEDVYGVAGKLWETELDPAYAPFDRGFLLQDDKHFGPFEANNVAITVALGKNVRDKIDFVFGGYVPDLSDSEEASAIHDECVKLVSALESAPVLGVREGIRPYRKAGIRLEADEFEGKAVIYNYGYGGNGITLLGASEEIPSLMASL